MLKSKINIAYVVLDFKLSGVPIHILDLVKCLEKDKYNPLICCIRERGELAGDAEALGCEVIVLNRAKSKQFDLLALLDIWRLFRKRKIDIVHTHMHHASRYSHLAAKLAGVPVILTSVHDIIGEKRFKRNLTNKVLSLFTDKVITPSHAVKEDICRYDRIAPDKIMVLPYGIDVDRFVMNVDKKEIRKKLGLPLDAIIVGNAGRFATNKRHHILIKAMKRVIDRFPSALLMIVGTGKTEDKLKQVIEELHIADHVLFMGLRKDIPLVLSAMDIFALPSVGDPFPIALLEAGVSALPTVGVRDGGIPESIEDGKTGLLVSKDNPEELANALIY
ncbi:MAG TPA: glycosyltransferase [Nitrospinota bacterium]|nr:glycosyltransferase [Nitrospinota bacterium]